MSSIFSSLTTIFVLSLASVTIVSGQQPGQGASGDHVLRLAERRLASYPSIVAKIRHRVSLFDQRLVGSGSYSQLRTPREAMWRIELSTAASLQDFRFLRISNGHMLWIVEETPAHSDRRSIDLRRAGQKLGEPTADATGTLGFLELSALSDMIGSLNRHFSFGPAQSVSMADVDMWRLEGRWKPEVLSTIVTGQSRELPPQMPQRVVLALGRDDQIPYKIEYWRDSSGSAKGEHKPAMLMAIELYEVAIGGVVDASDFHPPDTDFVDDTEQFIKEIRARRELR